jgi:hypothetical protein
MDDWGYDDAILCLVDANIRISIEELFLGISNPRSIKGKRQGTI